MYSYIIEGGHRLKGRIRPNGNKNAALPCLAATLLSDEQIILKNVPDIEDVEVMLGILEALGSDIRRLDEHTYSLKTCNIKECAIPLEMAKQIRASILFAGPLLSRCGKVTLPPPGGDVIGRRRLDTHFLAFKELGARVEVDGVFSLQANKLVDKDKN